MKRFLSYISAAMAVLFVAVSALPVSAATASSSSSALSITPRKDLVVKPGQTVSDKLTISNLNSSQDLTLSLKVIDFSFLNQSGTPKLMIADNAPTTSWSLKPFIKLQPSVAIPAGKNVTVPYTVTIPSTQGAGSYYSAIEYAATGSNGSNVSLGASGVTLVFLSVPGTVSENMSLQKFGAYYSENNGTTGSYISIATSHSPNMLAYALKNSGNVAESPVGSITLRDMFNHQVKVLSNVNSNSSLALLGQTRLFTTCIETLKEQVALQGATTTSTKCVDPHLKPGRYTATLDVFYGQNGNQTHEITGTTTFWYIPWWLIAAVLAGILIIAGAIWLIVRKIRGSGKKSVSNARR